MSDLTCTIPNEVLHASLQTAFKAMIFCRAYASDIQAPQDVVYELMDALHEVPQILSQWGIDGNDIEKLKFYFGLFRHEYWSKRPTPLPAPNLVAIFEMALADQYKAG